MANFGALTDHFTLAASVGTLVESSKTPVANSRADALDENGDIADAAWYGNTAAELYEASCTYQVDTTDVNVATALKLGELATGVVVTSIEISTSNGDWPKITVSGILGTGALEQGKTYALPSNWDTLALIRAGGPYPYRQDDGVFGNREGLLPRQPSGYYREYTVVTPGSDDRGPRRIIFGADGDRYWTADHYASFRQIKESR